MARITRLLIRAGAPLALAFSQPLAALESMSAAELVSACKAHLEDRQSAAASGCRAFIQGYLAASPEIVAVEDRPSGFVARAMRTRGSRFSDAAEQRLNSRFCLPEGESLEQLVARVAAQTDGFEADAGASAVMRRVFEKHYLCDAVD
ncbi:Rap1a/Tai family immunity protein [Microbulbifer halophilus]|uniref:Rap1a/Tai family immunity protein n=1 Tax=Microbulbifer halophilus TaxID=453963 RepID=A0ABW5EBB3_9GAMM|nr:Rap1a/Tai family immunity protein [Microbulbifer halophilus]MCW8125955.1 Rap1a/Tai family immunity protein [Microbulbifer halophilus]